MAKKKLEQDHLVMVEAPKEEAPVAAPEPHPAPPVKDPVTKPIPIVLPPAPQPVLVVKMDLCARYQVVEKRKFSLHGQIVTLHKGDVIVPANYGPGFEHVIKEIGLVLKKLD